MSKLSTGIAFLIICTVAVVAYRSYYQSQRTGVPANIANRMMWPGYELPRAASDVTYSVDFGGCEAEFAFQS